MAIDLNELATAIGQLVLRFRLRRRTAAEWTSVNEVLLSAEFGYETDTHRLKIGDGVTAWSGLPYYGGGGAGVASIVAGAGISVDATDPANPIITASGSDGSSPDVTPSSPDAMDDEFSGSTLDSKWAWLQQHTATATVGSGRLALSSELTSSNLINAIEQTIPAGTCAFVTKMGCNVSPGNSFCGIQLHEVASGNCIGFGFYNNGGGAVSMIVASGSVASGYTGVVASITTPSIYYSVIPAYLKVEITSTNFIFSVSADGISYQVFGSYAISGSFTTRPDKIGFATRNTSTTTHCVAVVDYFRRIA